MPGAIVVAVRIGPESASPLRVGADLAQRLGAPLVVAYVAVEVSPADALASDIAFSGPAALESVRTRALEEFEQLFPDIGVPYEFVVGRGPTAHELARIARDRQAYLMVTGTRGRGRLSQLILGDTTRETVRQAPCPVVVVPSRLPARQPEPDKT